MKKALLHTKRGVSLIEVLLAVATLGFLIMALVGALTYARESIFVAGAKKRALHIAEEGLEAVRSIRDQDYANLSNGPHGIAISNYHWVLSGVSDFVDGFTREIIISDIDPASKKVVINVTWQSTLARVSLVSLEAIISDWKDAVANVPKWLNSRLTAMLDLPGVNDAQKIHTVGNYSYITRVDGANDFTIVNITDDANPVFTGGLNLLSQPKDVFVSGNYAYIASTDNNQELQVINITNPATPTQVSTFNAAGTADANGIWVDGNYAYIVRTSSTSNELIIINISNPLSPILAGSLNLAATAYDIRVSGNYAFIASTSNTQEVQIINITNKAAPSIASSIDMAGNTDTVTLEVGGNFLYVSRAGKIEIYDISNVLSPVSVLSYNAVGNVFDISIDTIGNFLFLATQGNVNEVEIVDITTPATAVQKSVYDMSGTDDALGISYEATKDRVYVVSGRDTEELHILAPY